MISEFENKKSFEILIFIPARSKSKRFKNKNLKKINGVSLIEKTINFSKKIKQKKYIYLSTDSQKYANIAAKKGAHVPFLRSSKNSLDQSDINDAINEFLKKTSHYLKFKYLLLLLPTQPLRKLSTFRKIYNAIRRKKVDTVISVKNLNRTEDTIFKLRNKQFVNKKIKTENSQFQNSFYTPCGCFYLTSVKKFKKKNNIFNGKIFAIETHYPEHLDIDKKFDLKIANLIKNIS